jgi:glucose-1-phosphate cytidylyltransferase
VYSQQKRKWMTAALAEMNVADTPVVILAGGKGARFDHESQVLPKPLIVVAGKPILEHIIDSLAKQGFKYFIVATGYLGSKIEDHFAHHDGYTRYDANSAGVDFCRKSDAAAVMVVDTGIESNTGERLVRLVPYLNRRFVLTYGDGLSDVDMKQVLVNHSWAHTIAADDLYVHPDPPLITVTAVHPPGRFGVIKMGSNRWGSSADSVMSFDEKPSDSLINGGFMVVEPAFIRDYLWGPAPAPGLESHAIPALARDGKMRAHVHTGYWKCMDTRRDLEQIESDVKSNNGKLPWMRGEK